MNGQWDKLSGYLAIPHELLHIIGFWLVGKRCKYKWGDLSVTPKGNMTRRQRLVGRLLPFIVFFILLTIFTILSGLAYRQVLQEGIYFWFVFWTILAFIAGLYTGSTLEDLRRAYLLIFNKPWYSSTPFDFMYWPIVDWPKTREEIKTKAKE